MIPHSDKDDRHLRHQRPSMDEYQSQHISCTTSFSCLPILQIHTFSAENSIFHNVMIYPIFVYRFSPTPFLYHSHVNRQFMHGYVISSCPTVDSIQIQCHKTIPQYQVRRLPRNPLSPVIFFSQNNSVFTTPINIVDHLKTDIPYMYIVLLVDNSHCGERRNGECPKKVRFHPLH